MPAAAGDRGRIERVLEHIHHNYASPLSIDVLADVAALSPSGLHRLFVRHTQQNVSAYVMRLRIGEACALLSGGRRPIAHVAGRCGLCLAGQFQPAVQGAEGHDATRV